MMFFYIGCPYADYNIHKKCLKIMFQEEEEEEENYVSKLTFLQFKTLILTLLVVKTLLILV